MSELIVNTDNRATIRWKLLTGASALALASYLSSAGMAHAADSGRPVIWFEADGQFSLLSADNEAFLPSFVLNSPFGDAAKAARKKPPSEWDEGAKLSFQPPDSDWIMSLGVKYGKSSRHEVNYQQTKHRAGPYSAYFSAYQDSKSSSGEKHLILDFQAGKDFGLGMFGHDVNSVVSAGVRYAQFDSRNDVNIKSITAAVPKSYYIFHGALEAKREFHGVGPSLSWDASADLAGNLTDGSLAFDWGVNGALLFGRQRVKGHYEKTKLYQSSYAYSGPPQTVTYRTIASPRRSKNVTVPNLGAYAALSLRYTNAKVSLGYRADMFFGAIDGGIATAKKENRSFNGPYASVSIGIGD